MPYMTFGAKQAAGYNSTNDEGIRTKPQTQYFFSLSQKILTQRDQSISFDCFFSKDDLSDIHINNEEVG